LLPFQGGGRGWRLQGTVGTDLRPTSASTGYNPLQGIFETRLKERANRPAGWSALFVASKEIGGIIATTWAKMSPAVLPVQ
jgi:hypothetical protein